MVSVMVHPTMLRIEASSSYEALVMDVDDDGVGGCARVVVFLSRLPAETRRAIVAAIAAAGTQSDAQVGG